MTRDGSSDGELNVVTCSDRSDDTGSRRREDVTEESRDCGVGRDRSDGFEGDGELDGGTSGGERGF